MPEIKETFHDGLIWRGELAGHVAEVKVRQGCVHGGFDVYKDGEVYTNRDNDNMAVVCGRSVLRELAAPPEPVVIQCSSAVSPCGSIPIATFDGFTAYIGNDATARFAGRRVKVTVSVAEDGE